MEKLIGRKEEIAAMTKCLESERSEFVILYGRRRIGKTFLVRSYFKDKYDFHYVGAHHLKQKRQLENFALALQKYAKSPFPPELGNWFEAFRRLQNLLEASNSKKKVVFIDEMPWIDSPKSDFVKALEQFWNGWVSSRDDILFIACGSSTSWMMDKIVENQGGLHNRITRQIYLRPFTLNETEQYLTEHKFAWDRYQITQLYMTLGGVPFYLSHLDSSLSLAQNIDKLCFTKNGILRGEYDELYNVLFKDAENYTQIVRKIAEKKDGMTRQEIVAATQTNGNALTKILRNLERNDFIVSYKKFGNKSNNAVYRVMDFYTLFYYKFMEGNKSGDESFWTHNINQPNINAWQGISFESVALMHTYQIKKKLGINGMATSVSCWRDKESQIDLLIDRADRIINLCEIKFSVQPYEITKDYEEKCRSRLFRFLGSTKTKKGIATTFITTFGIAKGKHSSFVQNEVTMDDLFEPAENQ